MTRMPAQWEPHEAVWLAWPYDTITFGSLNQAGNKVDPGRLTRVEKICLQVVEVLQDSERVHLIGKDKKQHSDILQKMRMFVTDYADVWTRDYMPSFIDARGKLQAVKWQYDAYGAKFPQLMKDNLVWQSLNKELKLETTEPGILLEGGAIDVNGQGILLTTEQCLLARNSHLNKADYEKIFAKYLGISKVIWLKQGVVNDHTDGHVDEIARFVSSNKIVCAWEDNPNDPNYQILNENYTALQNAGFEVIKLPMPHMIYNDGRKAPASYANFYISNKAVLVGIFNDPNDEAALQIIQSCFPDKQVIGIDSTDLVYGGGGIHCMTREQPLIITNNK